MTLGENGGGDPQEWSCMVIVSCGQSAICGVWWSVMVDFMLCFFFSFYSLLNVDAKFAMV